MKKVIIIGATSGIGKGLAERFLREEIQLVLRGVEKINYKRSVLKIKIVFIVFPMLPKIPIQSDN